MREDERPPLDPMNPQITCQRLPGHHASADMAHVLARIRAFERFFADHVHRQHHEVYEELYAAALEMLRADLAPYALDLALSLIALEDRTRARGIGPRRAE